MDQTRNYITTLFEQKKIDTAANKANLLEGFIYEDEIIALVIQIKEAENIIINKWAMKSRLDEISRQMIAIPNATVGKLYKTTFDLKKMGWDDFSKVEIEGLNDVGLTYFREEGVISGTPTQSGDIKLTIKFTLNGESDSADAHEKVILLIVNPDPKSLWKNKPGDKDALYWKEENVSVCEPLGDRLLVASSKRGRSHANVGSFRDDDFAFKYFEDTGWSLVTVADGAGSARLSRKGSSVATKAVVDFFQQEFSVDVTKEFDEILLAYKTASDEDAQKKLSQFISGHLSKAAWSVHQSLVSLAKESGNDLKDFHTTLIFTLFKKYDFGYAFLSFGVGDCPIALINKDITEVTLMNWLDVGEYGGGTRFITMPEIFTSDKFYTRFRFKLIEDFSYLMMMTDGVYDPKFVVEANLEKIENWKSFITDVQGNNEDKIKVDLNPGNKDVAEQLSTWMDFWSPGNHDDRTLAIVF